MHSLTLADLDRLGRSSGFRYRLPARAASDLSGEDCVVQGRVEQRRLRPGVHLALSDVIARQPFEATSESPPAFSAIVMLEGRAGARLAGQAVIGMGPGAGAMVRADATPMTAIHPAGQRMRSLNVSLDAPAELDDPIITELLSAAHRSGGQQLRGWQVPGHLEHAADQVLSGTWQGAMHALLCEGIGLQMLAMALGAPAPEASPDLRVSARDRRMLQRVIDCLQAAPAADHSLEDLARLACMSSSSLRLKFQQVYRCSVFAWLRERRLQLACEQLRQGCSVQQAAHFVGYRHATNFATAFRARYGIAPSELR
ncbi:TPA: helix-turn-helix transcriptional regulator [Stenotrophomonas maltophilia]|uniref:Helix-turn-helix transcriptional regulator n=1 Tax=Stenotrophomonas maltophilia TaxID=40324 RepID=A0AAI9C6M1_STEMA|nr:helix-turn-helix transcriptional regulator [Stenotrophomonas maltophilia]UUS13223.1 helix-turn-helix transcriptional regulator [Stenotrophomonas sp. CD2]HEL5044192.1 helix-turn-helix transcriptional regulator [Stenotrophomonas maltophilia]